MGAALAEAAVELGHEVVVVSGPVHVVYHRACEVIDVVTTQEMLDIAHREFARCDGAIGAAAPCDYQPRVVESQKIAKTGKPIELRLIETPDVVATLGEKKRDDQWVVGFALETEDHRFRATVKLEKKHCDLIVSNGPEAIDSDENQVDLIDPEGSVVRNLKGSKSEVAQGILAEIQARLIGNN